MARYNNPGLVEDPGFLRQHALSACELQSAGYSMPYQATSLTTLVQMVANNLGITLLPEIALKSGLLTNTDIEVRAFSEKKCRTHYQPNLAADQYQDPEV